MGCGISLLRERGQASSLWESGFSYSFSCKRPIRRRSWIEHFSFSQWDKHPIQKLLPCPAHTLSQPGLFWLLTKSHGVIRATSTLLCYFTWLHGWQQAGAIKDHLFYEHHPLAVCNNERRELPTPKTQQVGWKHFSMKLTAMLGSLAVPGLYTGVIKPLTWAWVQILTLLCMTLAGLVNFLEHQFSDL